VALVKFNFIIIISKHYALLSVFAVRLEGKVFKPINTSISPSGLYCSAPKQVASLNGFCNCCWPQVCIIVGCNMRLRHRLLLYATKRKNVARSSQASGEGQEPGQAKTKSKTSPSPVETPEETGAGKRHSLG